MTSTSLHITGGEAGLRALVSRAAGMDTTAMARLRQVDAQHVDVFVTTPFDVVVTRRIAGEVSRDGAAVPAARLCDVQAGANDLGPAQDAAWPGALPPVDGFELVDNLPVTVVRELADAGQALARQFSGPAGPPKSLLNQTVVQVEGNGHTVELPMRMIFACTSLGLIPGFSAPMDIPRHLRVAALGRWIRLDAPFGTVYHSTRLSLF